MFCKNCQIEVEPYFKERPDTPHAGELRCPDCKSFITWKKKDKNNGKRPQNKYKPKDFGINFCQVCLKEREHLGRHESLEDHHIIAIEDGGPDTKENIWIVCTPCHKLIHHIRTYYNEHYKYLWERYEMLKKNNQLDDSEEVF